MRAIFSTTKLCYGVFDSNPFERKLSLFTPYTNPLCSQRQKSATKLLKKRGMGRWAIASFGFQRKAASRGVIVALAQSLVGLVSLVAGFVALWMLKITLFYPLVAFRRTMKQLKGSNKKNATNQQQQAA